MCRRPFTPRYVCTQQCTDGAWDMVRKGSPVTLSPHSPFRSIFLIAERTLGEWKDGRSLFVCMQLEFILNRLWVISTCGFFLSSVCFCIWSEQSVKKQVKTDTACVIWDMLVTYKFCIERCYYFLFIIFFQLEDGWIVYCYLSQVWITAYCNVLNQILDLWNQEKKQLNWNH